VLIEMSKYRDKKAKGGAGLVGMGRSDLSPKGTGIVTRKLPTSEEALKRTDGVNIKIQKSDQVTTSFAMRARLAKNTG
jgi:hypothetical protein